MMRFRLLCPNKRATRCQVSNWIFFIITIAFIGIARAHYDDPYKHKCEKDEQAIQITGVLGKICSPECTNNTCPTDVPTGVTAKPDCHLHSSTGDQYCCLMCNPNATENVCGPKASCKAISDTGICTYDDAPPPPSSEHWEVFRSPTFEEMTEAISLTFANEKVGWVGGGDDVVGAKVMKTVDAGLTWETVFPGNTSQPKFDIFLSAAAKSLDHVVVGGALFQVYSTDGYYFNASKNDYVTPSQDAEIVPGGLFALIGENGKCNGVATSLTGNLWKCLDIGVNASLFPVRYGSMPTKDTWYVTSGYWPENEINKAKSDFRSITQKIRLNKRSQKLEFSKRVQPQTNDDPPYTALIAKTTDGGKTWTTVFQNTTDYYFNDIDCFSSNHCVAVAEGDSAHIFMTMDGGATWDEVLYDADPEASLMRVAMVSETEVWATGGHMAQLSFHGRFWHSMDGGKTFELEFIKGLYIIDIDMVDADHGYGIGLTLSTGLELVRKKNNSASVEATFH